MCGSMKCFSMDDDDDDELNQGYLDNGLLRALWQCHRAFVLVVVFVAYHSPTELIKQSVHLFVAT